LKRAWPRPGNSDREGSINVLCVAVRKIFMTFKGYIQTGNVILLEKQLNKVFDMVDFINQHEENVEDYFISLARRFP
jgi:hypothetical protein